MQESNVIEFFDTYEERKITAENFKRRSFHRKKEATTTLHFLSACCIIHAAAN